MATLSELRDMSNEQMAAVHKEACQFLFRLRIQAQTERLDVPSELMRNRKLIARIKTLQREREIVAANAKAASEARTAGQA
jgi:large subunit ribosomal protein L29